MSIAYIFSLLAALMFVAGCGEAATSNQQAEAGHDHEHGDHDDHGHAEAGHVHGAWWCDLHGVPEEECALCDSKLAAEFQRKGDWCREHDRPDSQCFVCHPELKERFAARYEAKYGKKPPEPRG